MTGCALSLATALAITVAAAQTSEEAAPTPLRVIWDFHIRPENTHVTDWLAEQGWCWAIEVPPNAPPEVVLPLKNRGFTVVGQIHAHPDTREWHWSRRGVEPPDIDAFVDLMRQANTEPPRIQFFMEDDSAGVGFSAEYLRRPPRTHQEARDMLDEYLGVAMAERHRYPDVTAWAMAGFAGTTHHYARHGADGIIVERANDDIEDLQTAIAFARGASRQFGCEWGIDLSLWWGVIYACVQDLPASLYTRHLWLSYISGAQMFRIEGGDLLVRPDGPTVVAKAIAQFALKARELQPGNADAPVAVILPADHGWMTPAYWRTTNEAWNYARVPYRQGDRGIDGFFGTAFPGAIYAQDPYPFGPYEDSDEPASPFALSCITPEFAPTPDQAYCAEPPLPFGHYPSRRAARDDFARNTIDPSPYRPMGDSRWGDIFDVLTDDVSGETLMPYKAVLLLGPVRLSAALKERLMTYVNSGGRVIIAAGVATPADSDLCGVAIEPELRVGRGWQSQASGTVHEPFRYCAINEDNSVSDLEILVRALNGDPVIVGRPSGAGKVYTCLIPWFEGGNNPLSGPALHLLDAVITPLQPVLVDGPPASWVSASGDSDAPHRTVALANHAGHHWQGKLSVADIPENWNHCLDVRIGEPIPFQREGKRAVITITVPPYDVRVVRWQPEP